MTQNLIATATISPNKQPKIGNIYLSTILSLIVIATAALYYSHNVQIDLIQSSFQLVEILILSLATGIFILLPLYQGKKPKVAYLLLALGVVAMVFNYDSISHAQILDGIDDALGDVGTAAGDSFATEVLEAVISLIRIVVFTAVAGAVIAAIIFGVTQSQWQAPVLVVSVIVAVGLFLEIMGVVVFG